MLYAWGKRAYILIFLPFVTYIFTLLTSVFRDGGKVTSARAKLLPGCHSSVLNLTTQEKNPSPLYHLPVNASDWNNVRVAPNGELITAGNERIRARFTLEH